MIKRVVYFTVQRLRHLRRRHPATICFTRQGERGQRGRTGHAQKRNGAVTVTVGLGTTREHSCVLPRNLLAYLSKRLLNYVRAGSNKN